MVRFIRECGLLELGWPDDNLLLTSDCHGRWGKGPAAWANVTPGVSLRRQHLGLFVVDGL